MILSLIFLIVIFIVISGYSALFKEFILNDYGNVYPIDFVYGVLFLSSVSIFLNLFTPLAKFSYVLLFLGVFLFAYYFLKKKIKINFIVLISILLFLIFISADNSLVYDSMLYHLQSVKYNYEFKSILGLSNIEPRLGMNSIWHSFISLFNINQQGYELVYYINLIIYASFISLIFQNKKYISKFSETYLFLSISILYILSYSFFHPHNNGTILNNLGSPEVDTIGMILFLITISLYLTTEKLSKNGENLLLAFIFLAITVKITNVILFLVVIFIFLKSTKKNFFSKYYVFLYCSSLFWILKSILLSGCLFFPIKQTCMNFSWSLGAENVENYKNIISAFNRGIFTKQEWSNFDFTIYSFDWFIPWFKNYFLNTELLTISFLIILIFLLLNILYYLKELILKKKLTYNKNELFTFVILIISIYIWLKAPEIRLGYGPIISITVFFIFILIKNINFIFKSIKFCKLLIIFFMVALIYDNKENTNKFNDNTFKRQFDYSGIKMIYSSNNFQVYRPMTDSFCNYFNGFCSYQGYKVTIEKTPQNYFLIKNNW